MTALRLECAVASRRTGELLAEEGVEEATPLLHDLAATLPELLGGAELDALDRVALSLDPACRGDGFAELLLLSASHVHVIHPLPGRAGVALLATAPAGRSVGLVLSQVHARAAELEREP